MSGRLNNGKRTLNLLQVCDEDTDKDLFAKSVEKLRLNLSVSTVSSSEEAICYLEGRGAFGDRLLHPLPHFIVLEIRMQHGQASFDLLDWLSASPKFSALPIIIFTSTLKEGDFERATQMGANAIFFKPSNFEEWQKVVKQIYDHALQHLQGSTAHNPAG